jgi:outer membrane protein assembly factor BamD
MQFERVRDNYPDSLYGKLAEFRIAQCKEKLAGHELYVGDYYARVGRNTAARARYQYVLNTYPQSDAALLARERLARVQAPDETAEAPIEANIP